MIDTSKWEKFKINDLFDVTGSKTTSKEELEFYGYGIYPYITTQATNNGVEGNYNFYTESGNVLTIDSAVLGFCSYQEIPFSASDHVEILKPKFKLNKNIGLFLATLINLNQYKYSYGRKASQIRIKIDTIKLPVNYDKTPDWQWIENYMKSIEYKLPQTKNKSQNKKLDTSKWREFIISELFIIKPTLGVVSDDLIKGADVAYIAAKKSENGLKYMCQKEGFENWISKGNCIIFIQLGAGSAGYALYMKDDFIGMNGKISCGYIDNILNKYIGVFLTTVLSMERPKYSFGRSWTGERLQNTVIKLPTLHDKNNNIILDKSCKFSSKGYIPDWQYMENYIKSLPYGDLI